MPMVSKIVEQRRRPNRRNVYLDGRFAFGCSLNVVAKFRLREGMNLSAQQVEAIQRGEVRQACFDQAISILTRRLHSKAELQKKLGRREYGDAIIEEVLEDLMGMGYVDDARFARTKAMSAAQHKHHGRRRAWVELMKAGVSREVAGRAVEDVYETTDSIGMARQLAVKQAPRLRRLDSIVARRRLVGMLQRRGFNYEEIRPVVDEVLGYSDETGD